MKDYPPYLDYPLMQKNKPTTITLPFPIGSTVYHSHKYFCKANETVECEIYSYSITESRVLAECAVIGWGNATFNPSHLFATPEEAIAFRKEQDAKGCHHPMP